MAYARNKNANLRKTCVYVKRSNLLLFEIDIKYFVTGTLLTKDTLYSSKYSLMKRFDISCLFLIDV